MKPRYVQRCILKDGRLSYDYMGSTEFEIGTQAKALKRIFARGFKQETMAIRYGGNSIRVFMLAGNGFPFGDYREALQGLADNSYSMQEPAEFDRAVKTLSNPKASKSLFDRTNVWFDFDRDVLWTLSEKVREDLIPVLEDIKRTWAKK